VEITESELKAKIKEAVDSVKSEADEMAEAQQKKNKELLDELKKARRGQEVDPADHAALQDELSDTKAKLVDASKSLKTAQSETEKSKKALETESRVAHNLLVDNGLNAALIANGVKNPAYLEAAIALLKGNVKLEADGDNRVAKVGDKALADYVKEWAVGDKGKSFVDAPGNRGGGALGGDGNGENKGKFEDIKDPASRLGAISAEAE
jgi:hypothetical protein